MTDSQCTTKANHQIHPLDNPYDIFKNFDDWFEYGWQFYYDKLPHKYIEENLAFRRSGWVLCKGMKHGGWQPGPELSKEFWDLYRTMMKGK
jgi:hypothetical protein